MTPKPDKGCGRRIMVGLPRCMVILMVGVPKPLPDSMLTNWLMQAN